MLAPDSTSLIVLLASVLKPVDDTRMRGKFAETLLARPTVQVHIAGRATGHEAGYNHNTSVAEATPRLSLHPLLRGSRLSLDRLAAQWRFWLLLRRVRPILTIVHAPELLPLTLLWQALDRGRHFIYDIRENYALNVSTQLVYRGFTRRWLAAGLRWVEERAARRTSGIILAEASYAAELPFLNQLPAARVVVLENKYQPAAGEEVLTLPPALPRPSEPLRLLFSGTISELNGVWEAIALAEKLRAAWPGGARLTIIGFCQQPELLRQLMGKAAQHNDWLCLIGGAEPVPHPQIVAEIGRSHLGLLAYRPHPSSARCRPTKLFEYLAHGLPVLAPPNPLWQAEIARHGAGLAVDFQHLPDGPALVRQLQATHFYPAGIPGDVQWAGEGKKLWRLLDSFI